MLNEKKCTLNFEIFNVTSKMYMHADGIKFSFIEGSYSSIYVNS